MVFFFFAHYLLSLIFLFTATFGLLEIEAFTSFQKGLPVI